MKDTSPFHSRVLTCPSLKKHFPGIITGCLMKSISLYLIISTLAGGIYQSKDGGATWELTPGQPTSVPQKAWEIRGP